MIKKVLIYIGIVALLVSCGGGGGGGSSSSEVKTAVNNIGSSYMSKGLRFVHAVIDAKPKQINVGDKVYGPLRYGFTNYLPISSSPVNVDNYKQATSSQNVDIALGDAGRGTLLYCGRLEKGNKVTKFIPHEKTDKGVTKVRLLHALFKAEMLKITVNGETASTSFCKESKYIEVPAGVTDISVSRVVDGLTVYRDSVQLDKGTNYSIVAAGDADLDYKVSILKD